ncbi:hypothetical protein BWI17_11780 [Betaproteobacteria bacterium GR16-43]|nr:hypothetical protein BWI17_11780 [Betaproteobacteria bacterium GR16-43]
MNESLADRHLNRRSARARREAGARRSDMAYRALSVPPGAFAATRVSSLVRETATVRARRSRQQLRLGLSVWEYEGGAL